MNVSSSFLSTSRAVKPNDGPPDCFGGPLWDKNSTECAGGADANFKPKEGEMHDGLDPQSGSHVRRRCDWFQSCGARSAAQKNANGTLIPAQQILQRPAAPQPAPAPSPSQASPQSFGQWLTQAQTQHVAQQQRPTVQQVPMQPQAYQQVYAGGTVQPATTWQLNYAMPPFLSQPEIRHPGESIWALLLREVLRAMGKSLGHAVSHFFDSRPLK